VIANSMTGSFEFEKGDKRPAPEFNVFFKHYATYPFYSDGIWYLTQMRRWGQIPDARPDKWYHDTVKKVYRPDIYLQAAKLLVAEAKAKKSADERNALIEQQRDGPSRQVSREQCVSLAISQPVQFTVGESPTRRADRECVGIDSRPALETIRDGLFNVKIVRLRSHRNARSAMEPLGDYRVSTAGERFCHICVLKRIEHHSAWLDMVDRCRPSPMRSKSQYERAE
jgi:hypothetical protein